MNKIVGMFLGLSLLAAPAAVFAQSYPILYSRDVAYGLGGQNPYAGNCNYQDDCAFRQYIIYPQAPYNGQQTYWCNGYYSYTPCTTQYYYPSNNAPDPYYFYMNPQYAYPQTYYAYPQQQYMYAPYTGNTYNYYPYSYSFSW